MNDRKFDVAVVGNVGIDTNVYIAGADIDFGVESNFTENLDYVGQAGGYAARGYAQLGKRTAHDPDPIPFPQQTGNQPPPDISRGARHQYGFRTHHLPPL